MHRNGRRDPGGRFYASVRKTEAITTVFVDRLIGLGSMLVFACVMMLPNLALLREHDKLAAVAGVVVLMMLGCVTVLGLAFWGGLTKLWPGARAFLRKLPPTSAAFTRTRTDMRWPSRNSSSPWSQQASKPLLTSMLSRLRVRAPAPNDRLVG